MWLLNLVLNLIGLSRATMTYENMRLWALTMLCLYLTMSILCFIFLDLGFDFVMHLLTLLHIIYF